MGAALPLRAFAIAALALLALIVLAPAAEAACPKTSLLDIQDEVMCSICGVPLINAGGPQSDDEREFIRKRADACESKDQIKAALVAEYGPRVLAVPEKRGFDLAAYIVPVVVLLAALGLIIAGALRWRKSKDDSDVAPAEADAETRALDSDIQRYDL